MNALVLLMMHPLTLAQVEAQLPSATHADAPPNGWVATGREVLDHQWPWNYPWYDPQSDAARRVEIPKPWDWSWLWNWFAAAGDWLKGLLQDWNLNWLWDGWRSWSWRSLLSVPISFWQWTARIGLVLLLGLLVYLVFRTYRKWWGGSAESEAESGKSGRQEDDSGRIEALPFPVSRGRLDLLAEARRHYQAGDYPQAIIYLFSFQLVRLDRQQIIRLTRGKTNRQYLREVGPQRALGRLVEQTMVAFEDVFFGNRHLDRARFESCWSRLDEFESLAAEGAG